MQKPKRDVHISGNIFHTELGHISVVDNNGHGWSMGINIERENVTPDDLRKLADYIENLEKESK